MNIMYLFQVRYEKKKKKKKIKIFYQPFIDIYTSYINSINYFSVDHVKK